MKKFLGVFLALVLVCSLLASCGEPKGGLLYINVPDPDAKVKIGKGDPVPFKKLSQPLDLEPIIHKVSVTWSDTGEEEIQYANIVYGQTQTLDFNRVDKVPFEVISPIPAKIKIGNLELGEAGDKNLKYYPGQRKIQIQLLGFGNIYESEQNITGSEKIIFQPGADDSHGSLYIEGESSGLSFNIKNVDNKKPLIYEGSIFIPFLKPGVVEITESKTIGVTHFANIIAGKTTKIRFQTNFENNDKQHKLLISQTLNKLTILTNWNETGVTISELDPKNAILSDYDFSKSTPFIPSGFGRDEVVKVIIAKTTSGFGATSISGRIPNEIKINIQSGKISDAMETPKLLAEQRFTMTSPDGQYFYDRNAIVNRSGGFFLSISDFYPGDWDLKNKRALVTKINKSCPQLETRIASLSGGGPQIYNHKVLSGLDKTDINNEYYHAYFTSDGGDFLGVYGNTEKTTYWRGNFRDLQKEKEIKRGSASSSLFWRRFLVLQTSKNIYSNSFIMDLYDGRISEDIPDPKITSAGKIACFANPEGASAGIIYSWEGNSLKLLWAGVFMPKSR